MSTSSHQPLFFTLLKFLRQKCSLCYVTEKQNLPSLSLSGVKVTVLPLNANSLIDLETPSKTVKYRKLHHTKYIVPPSKLLLWQQKNYTNINQ